MTHKHGVGHLGVQVANIDLVVCACVGRYCVVVLLVLVSVAMVTVLMLTVPMWLVTLLLLLRIGLATFFGCAM